MNRDTTKTTTQPKLKTASIKVSREVSPRPSRCSFVSR